MVAAVHGIGTGRDAGGDEQVSLALIDGGPLRERVLALAPLASQQRWSGVPVDTLPPAERDPAQRPVAILLGGEPVGFMVLHGGAGAGSFVEPGSELLVRALFVDARFQRRGIGGRALAQLPAFVRALDPGVRRLVLSVNVENIGARRAYARAGFRDTGARFQRPGTGRQLVLELRM